MCRWGTVCGGGTVVDADVECVGMEFGVDEGLGPVEQLQQAGALGGGGFEEGSDVSARNDQRMAGRHGVTVAGNEGQLVATEDA